MARMRSHREGYTRRRPRDRNRARAEAAGGASGLTVAGLDADNIDQNPDQYIGEVFQGAVLKDIVVPDSVAAGGEVLVTGTVKYDFATRVVTTRGMRVRAEGPTVGENAVESWEGIQGGDTRNFALTLPAPADPDQTMVFKLHGEATSLFSGWETHDTEGPYRIEVVSKQEQQTRDALDYTPFALGGAGAGYALAGSTGAYSPMQGALAGAAVGVGYHGLRQRGVQFVPTVDIDTTTLAAVGLAGVGVAMALNSSGASGVLGPLGGAAGSAVEAGRSAVRSARGR